MRALLLAAGLGTRLRPITDSIPKCLVPINGRPLLDYWFDLLFESGIERALVNTHYFADRVATHIASSAWKSRIDQVFEPELLGTGGTLVANSDYFGDVSVLLAHADNLTDFSVGDMVAAHARRPVGCVMTMLSFRTDDPKSCGILELDRHGLLKAFHEKVDDPPGDLANGAVYLIEPEMRAFASALNTPFVDLQTEVIPHFLGRIQAYEHTGYHRDIGNPASLATAEADARSGGLRQSSR
ncbi:MAG: nucleotidyltransferase family protein [Alphaproteobacteria bacterium]|nr:nucleotidyltransferase family protein [Alphaproteobacteria bacterium]